MRDQPYGCHNRAPFKTEQVLHHVMSYRGKVYVQKTVVPFRNTMDCQYTLSDLGQIDPGCKGCSWRKELAPA